MGTFVTRVAGTGWPIRRVVEINGSSRDVWETHVDLRHRFGPVGEMGLL